MKTATLHPIAVPVGSTSDLEDRYKPSVNILAYLPGYSELPEAALQGDVILLPARAPLTPTRRLIVLVPPGDVDENALVRRVWQLAASSNLSILYLALEPDEIYVAYQRRRVSGLASLTASKEVRAKASVSVQKSWPQALAELWHPGDLLVCLAAHRIPRFLVWQRTLGEQLAEAAPVPVYLLGGFKINPAPSVRHRIKELLVWTASLLVMAIFFAFQVGIDRASARPVSTIVICLSVLVEVYLIKKVNDFGNFL